MSLVQIPFHDTAINAIETDEGVHIAIKPVAEALGLDWSAQYRRLQRQPWAGVAVMAIPSPGGYREPGVVGVDHRDQGPIYEACPIAEDEWLRRQHPWPTTNDRPAA
ncbi:MAG: hypothetical protein GX875_05550 [Propionibacterium sp.]|nr:hypothetical protein [Propionibacterium sp.]